LIFFRYSLKKKKEKLKGIGDFVFDLSREKEKQFWSRTKKEEKLK